MMKFTSKVSKGKLVSILGLILVGLVVLPEPGQCDAKYLVSNDETTNDRIAFKNYKVDPEKIPASVGTNEYPAKGVAALLKTNLPVRSEQEQEQKQEQENESGGIFKVFSDIVKKITEPKQFFDLAYRYHKWFSNYKAFQKITHFEIPDAVEVLKLEYAREEAAALAEDEENHHDSNPYELHHENDLEHEEEPEVKVQSLEFIFRVLKRLISRLECSLKRLEDQEGVHVDVEINPKLIEMDEEAVRKSMEGIKKSVIKSATDVLTGEALGVARVATLNGLAAYMETKADVGDALDHLRPIILLLSTATTPLFLSYLSSLKFRAAFSFMNRVSS